MELDSSIQEKNGVAICLAAGKALKLPGSAAEIST